MHACYKNLHVEFIDHATVCSREDHYGSEEPAPLRTVARGLGHLPGVNI